MLALEPPVFRTDVNPQSHLPLAKEVLKAWNACGNLLSKEEIGQRNKHYNVDRDERFLIVLSPSRVALPMRYSLLTS
jgi:hypothetical protein